MVMWWMFCGFHKSSVDLIALRDDAPRTLRKQSNEEKVFG